MRKKTLWEQWKNAMTWKITMQILKSITRISVCSWHWPSWGSFRGMENGCFFRKLNLQSVNICFTGTIASLGITSRRIPSITSMASDGTTSGTPYKSQCNQFSFQSRRNNVLISHAATKSPLSRAKEIWKTFSNQENTRWRSTTRNWTALPQILVTQTIWTLSSSILTMMTMIIWNQNWKPNLTSITTPTLHAVIRWRVNQVILIK